jgi:hypothetical protein
MVLSETLDNSLASVESGLRFHAGAFDQEMFCEPRMNEHDENCFKKEDRDELLRHGWQLAGIIRSLQEMKDDAKEKAEDIESRVRALENFKWIVWGMGSIAGILFGYIIQLMGHQK